MRGMLLGWLIALPVIVLGVWLNAAVHPAVGVGLMATFSVVGAVWMWREERAVKRQIADRTARKQESASSLALAELNQTPEWWDRQYDALVKKQIPRDWSYHRDHDLDEPITFYASSYEMQRYCLDCGVPVDRPPDG